MQINEWEHLVDRINVNYPGQQVEPLTAADWFSPLSGFPAGEVWDAIDRHRRDLTPGRDGLPLGHWAPSLAGILACLDANWREAARARREVEAQAVKAERNSRGGRPAPPETKEAMRLLVDAKRLPGAPGHLPLAVAKTRIHRLWEQLNERQERERMGRIA